MNPSKQLPPKEKPEASPQPKPPKTDYRLTYVTAFGAMCILFSIVGYSGFLIWMGVDRSGDGIIKFVAIFGGYFFGAMVILDSKDIELRKSYLLFVGTTVGYLLGG